MLTLGVWRDKLGRVRVIFEEFVGGRNVDAELMRELSSAGCMRSEQGAPVGIPHCARAIRVQLHARMACCHGD